MSLRLDELARSFPTYEVHNCEGFAHGTTTEAMNEILDVSNVALTFTTDAATAMLSYFQHKRDCKSKQEQRRSQIAALSKDYSAPLTASDLLVQRLTIPEIVAKVHGGSLGKTEILLAYGKKALQAHEATNCLAEIMINDASTVNSINDGPLSGVPVSIKDSELVTGYDATIGFSAWVNKPSTRDSTIVRILRDAGAIVHVKTTVPMTLLTCETRSDVFGRTTNPYNSEYASGGSSGGGASLIAYGGSKIEIGTDLAGSLRTPSHYSGIYTIKGSSGRFPAPGGVSSVYGIETIQLVAGPMASNLTDLEEFWKRIMQMKPWKYDQSCVPLPWREVKLPTKVRWGVMWSDDITPPSPACIRALQAVVDALKARGDDVVDFNPPDPFEALTVGAQLVFADGAKQLTAPVRWGENLDPGVKQVKHTMRYPRFVKNAYAWLLRNVYKDPMWADLVAGCSKKTVNEEWLLTVRRDAYRKKFQDAWNEAGFDLLLTVPNAIPAIPKGGMEDATMACCSYVFLFNVLDYAAGVIPVTFVDSAKDSLASDFKKSAYRRMGTIAKGAYNLYDPVKMQGLPIGVQVAGRRYEEEKVLEGMKAIEASLKDAGTPFVPRVF